MRRIILVLVHLFHEATVLTGMDIREQLARIKQGMPTGVKVVVVTKTRTTQEVMQVYETGHRIMGESRVQELLGQRKALPADIEWHLVGHLQTNKVKHIAPFVAMIHSADSLKLLQVIDKEGRKNQRIIPCLLQIRIAEEESKFGMDMDQCKALLSSTEYQDMQHVEICGLMGMATFTSDREKVRKEFRTLKSFHEQIKAGFFAHDPRFREISMGMSDDYPIALEEGSTMVRLGSVVFSERP